LYQICLAVDAHGLEIGCGELPTVGWGFIAMKLQQVQPHLAHHAFDPGRWRIHEQPYRANKWRQGRHNFRCAFRHDMARAVFVEHQADGITSMRNSCQSILNASDAANFYPGTQTPAS